MTAAVAVIEDEGEVVEDVEPLTKREATALNKKIQTMSKRVSDNAFELLSLLEQAATGSIHKALGYNSWTAWYSDNVQIDVSDKSERKMLVTMMSGKGMSQRAIAASLGIGQATVSRDLDAEEAGDSDESPEATEGLDGKSYKRKGKAEAEESVEEVIDAEVIEDEPEPVKITNMPKAVVEAVDSVIDAVNRLLDLSEDDRFVKGRAKLADKHHEDIEAARDGLQEVLDKLFA